jgi:hypothetical protein
MHICAWRSTNSYAALPKVSKRMIELRFDTFGSAA